MLGPTGKLLGPTGKFTDYFSEILGAMRNKCLHELLHLYQSILRIVSISIILFSYKLNIVNVYLKVCIKGSHYSILFCFCFSFCARYVNPLHATVARGQN